MTARNCSKSYIQSSSTYIIYLPNLPKLQSCNYLHWAKRRLTAVWAAGVSSTLSLCLQCCPLQWCIYNTFWCTEYTCFLCSEPPNAQWSRFSFWRNKRSHLHLKGYLPSIKLIATITGFTLFYLFSSSLTMPQPHFSSRNNLPLCIFICGSFCWVVLQDICMTHFLATFWHYFKCYLAIHLFCRMWAHTCT